MTLFKILLSIQIKKNDTIKDSVVIPILQKESSTKNLPNIDTLDDFNKKFYEQLVIWNNEKHLLNKKTFIMACEGDIYISPDSFFKENSDIFTIKGEKSLQDILHIFKNLSTQLHSNLKWNIQINGFLSPISLKSKISDLRYIAFMRYVEKYMGTKRPITFYISSQGTQNFLKQNLCTDKIGLKMIPARDF